MDPATHADGRRAVAIARGDQIVAVGDDAEIRALAGAATRVIDLARHDASTPGLIDAHCHLYGLGVDLENVSVRELASEADTVRGRSPRPRRRGRPASG